MPERPLPLHDKPTILGEELRPVGDRVIVVPIEDPKETESGIVFTMDGDPPCRGLVMALGRGIPTKNGYVPYDFQIGDVVWFDKFAGAEQKCQITGVIYRFLKGHEVTMVEEPVPAAFSSSDAGSGYPQVEVETRQGSKVVST